METLVSKKFNKVWHLAHKMPTNPNLAQRVQWHIEHAKNCNCRSIPPSIAAEIEKLKKA